MTPSKHAWLVVPLAVLVTWLLVRPRDEATAQHTPGSGPLPSEPQARTQPLAPATPTRPVRPDPVPAPTAPVMATQPPVSPPAPISGPAAARPLATERPTLAPPDPIPPAPPPDSDEAPAGRFTDKTGWGDGSVGKQLNRELMPLAAECIERAKDRKPFLTGMLSFTMVISPTGGGKAVVSSLKVRPDNKIEDPELWECIRESSFALEGLTAPHDFDISMPIGRDDAG